jgi:hypothetical protein
MLILFEVVLECEEASVPSTFGKSSAHMCNLGKTSKTRERWRLTLIAGSPWFFWMKVGTWTGEFCVFSTLYCT